MADKEEEAIRKFTEITGTDEALAHSILQDVDYNLQVVFRTPPGAFVFVVVV